MAYGINIYKASGVMLLDMTYKLTRFLYHTVATAGQGGSANVADLVASRCVGFSITRNNALGYAPHIVSIADGSVSWSAPTDANSGDSDVYVIQWK